MNLIEYAKWLEHSDLFPLKSHHSFSFFTRRRRPLSVMTDVLDCNVVVSDVVWFGLVLWHVNHCWLFNAKSIFKHMNSSVSNNSV